MKMQTRIWESLWTGWCHSTNFLSMETWLWLQTLPSSPNNVLEPFSSLETTSMYENNFQFFYEKVQVCSLFSAQLVSSYALGLLCLCMRNELGQKNQAQSLCIDDFEYLIFMIFFQSFSILFHANPCQSYWIFPYWMVHEILSEFYAQKDLKNMV